MEDPQNIYDNPAFFAGYQKLRASGSGLNEILEQPALWSMLPESLASGVVVSTLIRVAGALSFGRGLVVNGNPDGYASLREARGYRWAVRR
jgi:hypothetical protein